MITKQIDNYDFEYIFKNLIINTMSKLWLWLQLQ